MTDAPKPSGAEPRPGLTAPAPGFGTTPPPLPPVPPGHFAPGPAQAPHPGYAPAGYSLRGFSAPVAAAVPPGPAPGLAFVGFWRRAGGYLIDVLVLLVPFAIVVMGFSHETSSVENGVVVKSLAIDHAGYLVGGLIAFAYFAGQWYAFGRTPGQRAVGISVVRSADGATPDGVGATLRAAYLSAAWLADAISPVLGALVGLGLFIGLVMVAADDRKQGWHDRLAGTFVIRRWP